MTHCFSSIVLMRSAGLGEGVLIFRIVCDGSGIDKRRQHFYPNDRVQRAVQEHKILYARCSPL